MLVDPNDLDLDTGKVILYFSASWCSPCKQFGPIFDKVASEIDTPCVKIDIDDQYGLAVKYNITNIPAVIILENGSIKKANTGFTNEGLFRAFVS